METCVKTLKFLIEIKSLIVPLDLQFFFTSIFAFLWILSLNKFLRGFKSEHVSRSVDNETDAKQLCGSLSIAVRRAKLNEET